MCVCESMCMIPCVIYIYTYIYVCVCEYVHDSMCYLLHHAIVNIASDSV